LPFAQGGAKGGIDEARGDLPEGEVASIRKLAGEDKVATASTPRRR